VSNSVVLRTVYEERLTSLGPNFALSHYLTFHIRRFSLHSPFFSRNRKARKLPIQPKRIIAYFDGFGDPAFLRDTVARPCALRGLILPRCIDLRMGKALA
jgi:hypothetical protein